MTTTASSRMRFAALGLSAALSVGVLAPFIATDGASAAISCTAAKANVQKADAKVKHDQKKFKKAKKKLRKDTRARKSVAVIKHDRKVVKRVQKHVKADKRVRAAANRALQTCTNPSTSTPQGTANPLSDLFGQLTSILSGVPGGSSAAPALAAIQKQLEGIPLSPEALTAALAAAQSSIEDALSNIDPTHASLYTVLNAIIDPLHDSILAASGGTGPGADLAKTLEGVQNLLRDTLGGFDLSLLTDALAGGGLPGTDSIPGLGSLTSLFGNIPGLGSLPL